MSFDLARLKDIANNYAKAWSSGVPKAVAAFYAEDGQIVINRGDVRSGQAAIADMAAGFYAELPDLVVLCDEVRGAADHAIFVWTLEGHHCETKNFVRVSGWEEWDLGSDLKIKSSKGWFDTAEYDRQVAPAA